MKIDKDDPNENYVQIDVKAICSCHTYITIFTHRMLISFSFLFFGANCSPQRNSSNHNNSRTIRFRHDHSPFKRTATMDCSNSHEQRQPDQISSRAASFSRNNNNYLSKMRSHSIR